MYKKVYLTLENGKVFEGYSFGAQREVIGELVFTTGMTGYIETLTDPSYYGQIVTQTFPLIGNYGVILSDRESAKCHLTAYVVREKCDAPSNFRCEMTLEQFLRQQDIPAVFGVDTRELTRIVREAGVMNAAITYKPITACAMPLRPSPQAACAVMAKRGGCAWRCMTSAQSRISSASSCAAAVTS